MKIKESMYQMMWTFKKAPIEIFEPLPRRLSILIDQRWQRCMLNERQIREATLAQIMKNLGPKEVKQ